MKKLLSLIFCIVATLTSHAQAGYDFSATNSNGYTLYYKILDPIRKRVEIVNAPGAMGMWGGYSFNGPFDVPATVENGGITYNVVSIDVFFMLGSAHGGITELTLHEGLEKIGYTTFWQAPLGNSELVIPSTVTSMGGSFAQPYWKASSVTVRMLNPIPTQDGGPGLNVDLHGYTYAKNLKIIVPTDVTHAYCNVVTQSPGAGWPWSYYANFYREEVKFGPTGYISYYLGTENFLIPAGCTAYIITGITPSGSIMTPDQAVVKAFTAGKIIPKQTGFILQGTPNSTVIYQANVTGPEESVTGNLLIGTATEQEFNASGYKYYIFSNNGDEGLGFYKQGTRNGASIKLKPHRAGLRLPVAIAPAKGFVVDFEAARRESETTGIRNGRPTTGPCQDVIYDLQGRRVTNPGRGIYIVNGKKVVKW